jgi:cysteine desulfurase family protein (TIGR01976 family)
MTSAMLDANANLGGAFDVSKEAVAQVRCAREAMVDFFNAFDPREIVFGQNMTTLTLAMSRTLAQGFVAGDEIILTRMDHDANVAPWLRVAEERALVVKWLDFDSSTFEYDLTRLDALLTPRTKLVAVNHASNVTGTINDVAVVARKAKRVGAIVYVDSVQYAPHGVIDVRAIGCDLLVCSAYKFYGPHHGILWGRLDLLESLQPYKVRAASDASPDKFETGTKSREAIAGILGAVEHFEWVGAEWGGAALGASRREKIVAGMQATQAYEDAMVRDLIAGLKAIPQVQIMGITADDALARRVPTISFVVKGKSTEQVARALAAQQINVWYGHNYGLEPCRRLGLLDRGGVVRLSIAQYNRPDEVERFIAVFTRWLADSCESR